MAKLTRIEVLTLISKYPNDPLKILDACGGLYICPKDSSGKRLGPMVGYAGTDENGLQFVGDIYANFGKAEEYVDLIAYWTLTLSKKEPALLSKVDVFCGLPEGGKAVAYALAFAPSCSGRYVYLEKVVTALKTASEREKSKLVFNRHEIAPGDRVGLVEDLQNNFSTTGKAIDEVIKAGGEVVVLLSIMNRSPLVDNFFKWNGKKYPVVTLLRRPYPEYKQDDPEVEDDILFGDVVWKPENKNEWEKIKTVMEKYSKVK